MYQLYGNFWDAADQFDGLVITTNGYVKTNGNAVLGRGIAKEATDRFPWLAYNLGRNLTQFGNKVFQYGLVPAEIRNTKYDQFLYTFPVKPAFGPNGEMGWKADADLKIIERSAEQLLQLVESYPTSYRVLIPRPGCGNGHLKWEDVKPVLDPLFDDRFTVVTYRRD